MLDLEELERLAAQATPGPWEVVVSDKYTFTAVILPHDFPQTPLVGRIRDEQDAAYISAACNTVPELIAMVRELERRCRWLEGHLDLKNANIVDLKKQAKTLAKWHTRSNDCPYPDDHDCPRLHNGICFASDDIMCECWIQASKEAGE